MSHPIIHTTGICKSFGDHQALAPLDLEVGSGQIVGLLGPNGAGKTTLLRMLTGITKPDEGTLRMWGQPHHRDLLSRMGYLPEERGLYKSMRVAEQVLYFAALRGMERKDAEHELRGWLERLEVEGWWNREVADLSKGMAQKNPIHRHRAAPAGTVDLGRALQWVGPHQRSFGARRNVETRPKGGHNLVAFHP